MLWVFVAAQEFIRLLHIFKNMTVELHKLQNKFLNSSFYLTYADFWQYCSLYNYRPIHFPKLIR